MNKIIIIGLLILALFLSSCSKTALDEQLQEQVEPVVMWENGSEIKQVIVLPGDRIVYPSLQHLLEPSEWGAGVLEDFSADIAVIGEFIDETDNRLIYEYSDLYEKDVVGGFFSYKLFLITEVLKGDVNVGDVVRIADRYAIEEARGALISSSDITL